MKYKAIPWVQGNPLTLRIPLEKVIITPEGTQTTDYVLQEGDTVVVKLKSERKTFDYAPEIEGNIAIITDESRLLVGLYAVEVTVTEVEGAKRRSYYPNVIQVVGSTPEMLGAFDDFPMTDGIVLDTPGIFFDFGGGGTVDAYTKAESDARFVHKTEMVNYPTQQQMQSAIVSALQPYATRQYVDGKVAGLATEDYVDTEVAQESARATGVERVLGTSIENISALIPSAASAQNQLADKDFVNHSIATNTANFIGTFNSVSDLEAYSGQKTNNDYAFVIEQDAAGNEYYDRYKWNGSAWLFEYKIENTAFTAAQWAAIQSGITSALVAKLSDLPTNEALQEALTLINTTLSGKQDTISDLAEIRSGASAGATAYQKPQGGIPASDIAPNVIPDVSNREKRTAIVASYNTQDPSQPVTSVFCNLSTYYRIPVPIESLTLMLPPNPQSGYVENIVVFLTGGTAPAVTIQSSDANPAPIYYHDGYAIESGKTYELNILWNGAAWVVASVEIVINN